MADLMTRIAAPGARCLLFCFYARHENLPRMSFSGASRAYPGLEPGEMEQRVGHGWDVAHLTEFASERREATFLMTRRNDEDIP